MSGARFGSPRGGDAGLGGAVRDRAAAVSGEPVTPDDLFRRLDELGIPHETQRHTPVFTVEEARAVRGNLPGMHTKNLFVRDKKERMWLIVCEADLRVDLHEVAEKIGSKRLSFGSPQRLLRHLGVTPGAVNPFAVLNDRQRAVGVVLERALVGQGRLNFHPLDNAMTTAISFADLERFLEAEGHTPLVIRLGNS